MPRFSALDSKYLCLAILTIGCVLTAVLATLTSLNRTEVAHLGAASYFWRTGRFDLFHVNPPFGRIVSGFPIWLYGTEHDLKAYSPRSQDRTEWPVGEAFVRSNEPEKVRTAYILGRWALLPILFLGGWFGCRLAFQMFGVGADVVFAILWSFSPLFLGWGATLCPDMAAAALGITAVYFFRNWLEKPTWKNVAWAGLFIGLLPLAKTTWIIAFGLFPLLWLLAKNRPSWKQLAVILLLALYFLNMGYLFDGSFRLLKDYDFISESFRDETGNRFRNSVLGYVPVPLPAEFVQGIDTQKRDFEKGLESYFFGKYSDHGWPHYYLVVLFLKEPLGTLSLALLGIGLLLFNPRYRATWNDEILIAVPFVVLFLVVSLQTGFSIHPRYLLPALPFFYLFACRTGKAFSGGNRILRAAVAVCLVCMVGSSLYVYPYSLSYMNEAVPVRKRPEILLGSNIDWGQEAYFLKAWQQKHPEAAPMRIAYPCPEEIERIGIETAGLPPTQPEAGWFALGVNDLYAASGLYAWLRKVEPVARIGYSIYIYDIPPEQANQLREDFGPDIVNEEIDHDESD